ncbi:MAG: MSH system secretin MshL [Idiomarinaceae bacterium HL-53]|nr:MAG: MSH system secretin MshL [Idiomarinaceae bacterium HL-53]CUS47468.1 MSHA biogenesis protein MshL [Idiomarinaceae bacterium HL-53]
MKAIVAQKQFRLIQSMVLCASIFVLPACVSKPPEELAQQTDEALSNNTRAARERSVREVPADVRAQLRQGIDLQQSSVRQLLEEPRFSIQARDMAASDFFAQLTAETPYSVVVHPDVRGAITVNLRDVTLQEALNVVQDIFGYDIRKEGRIYRVFPAGLRTETLSLNYLSLRRQGISQTQITSGGVAAQGTNNQGGINNSRQNNNYSGSDLLGNQGIQNGQSGANIGTTGQSGSSISTTNETDFWKELESILQGIIGEGNGRQVVVSPQAGLATVRAFPAEIRAARDFLSSAEASLQRQVVLEARIVEVELNEQYQQGVDWSRITSDIGSGVTEFSFSGSSVDAGSLGGVMGITFNNQTFSGMVELLSTQGQVQVLSSPRVTATNNQKAVIKIGEDEYFVTDVSTTTVTGTATTSTPNIQLTPFFSGIALDVTPQIGENGDITLHIHPSVTETTEQEKIVSLNDQTYSLPLARSNIRESDTIIRARDGEVVIIGGLMQTEYVDDSSSVPLLGDIPFLGELFTNRRQRETKKELVIMLRPTVVGVDTWDTELERSRELLRRWYNVE